MGSLFPTSSGPVACRGPEVSLVRRGEKRWRRTVDGPARTEDAGLHMQRRRKPVIERNESERSTAEPRHHLCASFSVLPPLAHRRTACHGSCGHQGTGAPHPERSDGDASSCVLFPALFLCTPRISTRTVYATLCTRRVRGWFEGGRPPSALFSLVLPSVQPRSYGHFTSPTPSMSIVAAVS